MSDQPRARHRYRGGAKDERAPGAEPLGLPQKFSVGFALMSVVPILLALFLMSRPPVDGPFPILGLHGVIVFLMIASAVTGFTFIRRELARTFLEILRTASQVASDDLEERIRNASDDEMGKISETIRDITGRLEEQSSEAERTQERLRGGISRAVQAIQTSRDERSLLEFMGEGALDVVDARTAYVVAVDEESGDFVTLAARGEGADELRERRVPLGAGIPGLAARERKVILLPNLGEADLEGESPALPYDPETTIAAPLFHGETLHGVLILHDRKEGGQFSDNDLEVISSLTALTSTALGQKTATQHLEDSLDAVLAMFSEVLESRDPYARGHSARVARYCEEMARSLKLDSDTIRTLRRAALLHDIGKVCVPESVLRKEGKYTDEELEHVRTHPIHAEKALRAVPQLVPVAPLIRNHNERCDGTGYPDGMQGDDIPLTTHILIVANAFDAMTSDRSFRQAMSLNDALEKLKEGAGQIWDRRVVHAFLALDPKVLKATGDVSGAATKGQGNASISVKD